MPDELRRKRQVNYMENVLWYGDNVMVNFGFSKSKVNIWGWQLMLFLYIKVIQL